MENKTITDVTIKEYIDSQIGSVEKIIKLSTVNVEKMAISKAKDLEKRLEGMNEFREALKDQTSQLFPRKEHDMFRDRLDDCFNSIKKDIIKLNNNYNIIEERYNNAQDIINQKVSRKQFIFYIILSILSVVLASLAIFLK